MAEEFIEDIIASTKIEDVNEIANLAESESSSTEATDPSLNKDDGSGADDSTLNDQSSEQTKNESINKSADNDQADSNLSVEELASQLGWREDHTGDDAVDAVTYILRSKDIQKSMSKHNKDLKDQLSTLHGSVEALREHNEKVYQADVKKLQGEIKTLKAERKAAIELADVDRVEELDEQISERQKDIDEPKSKKTDNSEPSSNPAYDEWIEDNQWYLEDNEMAAFADTVAQQYNGAPPARVYALVRTKVQEVFPEKFESTKTETVAPTGKAKPIGPSSPVERSTNTKTASNSFSKADLSPEQVAIMRQFVQGGIMTEKQYIDDIAKMQEQ